MQESVKNGEVTTAFKAATIADGIAVKTPGDATFEIIKELVDEVVVFEEDEIAQGMLFLMENQKVVAEGAGAVTTAALLSGKYVPKKDENVVCVISGGNVDVNTLYRVIGTALTKEARRYSFNTVIQDKPGGLAELTKIISEYDANILSANLSRSSMGGALGSLTAEMVLETFNHDHIDKLKVAITEAGFEIVEIWCVKFFPDKCVEGLLKLDKRRGLLDENSLENTVIHLNVITCQSLYSADGKGVGDHSENEIIFYSLTVALDSNGIFLIKLALLESLPYGSCHVGKCAPCVFQLLIGGIAYLSEHAERRNICEISAVKSAYVNISGSAPCDDTGSVGHIFGDPYA